MGAVLYASDLHGSVEGAKCLLRAAVRHRTGEIVLLGDILGGRGWCRGVDETAVLTVLAALLCGAVYVRGNCDSHRDETAVGRNFVPYDFRTIDGNAVFSAHGHTYGYGLYPPGISSPSLTVCGHSHRYCLERGEFGVYCNVGSLGFPRGGNEPSYAIVENGTVTLHGGEGSVLDAVDLIPENR